MHPVHPLCSTSDPVPPTALRCPVSRAQGQLDPDQIRSTDPGPVLTLSFGKRRRIAMVRSVGSVARQSWFLPVILVVISVVGSWKLACITPFVAFAVAAGYALSARAALLTVMAIWLVNQVIG